MLKKMVDGKEIICTPQEEAEIRAEWAETDAKRAQYLATEFYKDQRKKEYPDTVEFLDAWVKNDPVALEAYRQKCLAVKLKYPKPRERV